MKTCRWCGYDEMPDFATVCKRCKIGQTWWSYICHMQTRPETLFPTVLILWISILFLLIKSCVFAQSDDTVLPVAPISPRMSNMIDRLLNLNSVSEYHCVSNVIIASDEWSYSLKTNYHQPRLCVAIGSDCLHWNISNINVSVAVVTNTVYTDNEQGCSVCDGISKNNWALYHECDKKFIEYKPATEKTVTTTIKRVTTLRLLWNGQPCGWQTEVVIDRKQERYELDETWRRWNDK